jgi:hypothetical protein
MEKFQIKKWRHGLMLRIVRESLSFQRYKDPKEALGLKPQVYKGIPLGYEPIGSFTEFDNSKSGYYIFVFKTSWPYKRKIQIYGENAYAAQDEMYEKYFFREVHINTMISNIKRTYYKPE